MSNKKILSVKPTKNPNKFIFETEMPADELKKYVHEWFDDRACNVYIDSIKPSGLWANKLFVNVSFDQHELPGHALAELQRLKDDFNKNLDAMPRESPCLWRICYKSTYANNSCVIENTPTYAKDLIEKLKVIDCKVIVVSSFGSAQLDTAYVKSIKVFNEKNEQIWPRETERLWNIHCKSSITNRDYALMNTREYAENLIARLKNGTGYIQLIDLKKNTYIVADVDSIKVFNEKNEQIWPKETEQKTYCEVVVAYRSRSLFVTHEDADEIISWMKRYHEKKRASEPCQCCCTIHDQKSVVSTSVLLEDIKHIYDENGNDMLADGLAKAQKPADVWHVEVRRQATIGDNKFDLSARIGLSLLGQLQSGKDFVSFHDVDDKTHCFATTSVLCLWNNEKTLWSKEDKKPDTSFKAPSLLSRIMH